MSLSRQSGWGPGPGAFSLVELLLGMAIIAFALIPVFTMTRTVERQAALSDYHVFWGIRALQVIQRASLYEYATLKALAGTERGAIDTRKIDLPPAPMPPEFERRLRHFEETLTFEEIKPGLARVTAKIEWAFPLDRTTGGRMKPKHACTLSCLVVDATLGLTKREELPL